jgi:hypothetical protein
MGFKRMMDYYYKNPKYAKELTDSLKNKKKTMLKKYLELPYEKIHIKYELQKYYEDNTPKTFHPLPSDKWVYEFIKKNKRFKSEKNKNRWYCNKNAIDLFSFKRLRPM